MLNREPIPSLLNSDFRVLSDGVVLFGTLLAGKYVAHNKYVGSCFKYDVEKSYSTTVAVTSGNIINRFDLIDLSISGKDGLFVGWTLM